MRDADYRGFEQLLRANIAAEIERTTYCFCNELFTQAELDQGNLCTRCQCLKIVRTHNL